LGGVEDGPDSGAFGVEGAVLCDGITVAGRGGGGAAGRGAIGDGDGADDIGDAIGRGGGTGAGFGAIAAGGGVIGFGAAGLATGAFGAALGALARFGAAFFGAVFFGAAFFLAATFLRAGFFAVLRAGFAADLRRLALARFAPFLARVLARAATERRFAVFALAGRAAFLRPDRLDLDFDPFCAIRPPIALELLQLSSLSRR
jgi:hypothetical protein